jgi:hypothetical protein
MTLGKPQYPPASSSLTRRGFLARSVDMEAEGYAAYLDQVKDVHD